MKETGSPLGDEGWVFLKPTPKHLGLSVSWDPGRSLGADEPYVVCISSTIQVGSSTVRARGHLTLTLTPTLTRTLTLTLLFSEAHLGKVRHPYRGLQAMGCLYWFQPKHRGRRLALHRGFFPPSCAERGCGRAQGRGQWDIPRPRP